MDQEKAQLDNKANVCNPNNPAGGPGREAGYQGKGDKPDLDNHSNQLNPNNPEFKGAEKDAKK